MFPKEERFFPEELPETVQSIRELLPLQLRELAISLLCRTQQNKNNFWGVVGSRQQSGANGALFRVRLFLLVHQPVKCYNVQVSSGRRIAPGNTVLY